eukprot:TRINITY_DN1290_c0_g1_i1.p1 TRINITY_DN1290_c0_g1~~TRINITY_DN1290_c0_g1_i1.p1  ORF type:complete len:330 (-),score=103.28 TRINITY_DN1290_c0_g1_i1:45-1034(-)
MTSCQPHHVSSRVFNQNSVKEALKSIQMKLKLFRELPTNGLAIFNGSYETGEGKIIKVNHAFEPPKPLHRGLYLCDDKFHTDIVREQLQDKTKIGVVVLDGKGAWWFALCGNARERLFKLEVDLPAKHGRGGQSANRFARLREERRDWYLKKVMEICERVFIGSDHAVNVEGIILAGCADLKNELFASQFLDQRIKAKVIKVVDTQYGGEAGFNEEKEKGKAMEKEKEMKKEKEEVKVLLQEPGEEFKDDQLEGNNFKLIESVDLLEWLMENYRTFGVEKLELISADTQEGTQLLKAFGGIGGFLRYKMTLPSQIEDDIEFDGDDEEPL